MKKLSGFDVFDYCMTAVVSIIAAAAGVILWGATFLLLTEAPWGPPASALESLSFFIPIMAIVAPMFYRRLWNGRRLTALWCVALAPILGLASAFLVAGLSMKLFSAGHRADYKTALLCLAIYAPIAFYMYRGMANKPPVHGSNVILLIITLVIGTVLWGDAFRDLGAHRRYDIIDLMSFIIPLVTVVLPVSFYLLRENRKPAALLCVALAPVLCLYSMDFFRHLSYSTHFISGRWDTGTEASLLSLVVYAPISVFMHHWLGQKTRKQQMANKPPVRSTNVILFIIILVIGIFLWGDVFRFLGANRRNGIIALVSFIIPLVAVVLPVSLYLLRENRKPAVLLCVALAPALCLYSINFFIRLSYSVNIISGRWDTGTEVLLLLLVVYAPIAVFMYHWLGKKTREQQPEDGSTVDS